MKIAVVYARYSSDNQTEQSIEGQLRTCEQYAQNNDLQIVNHYIDRAMTGTNDNRPDFQKMIKASENQEFQYIIVYKLDRFSRNKYETAKYKKILKDNGVKLVSAMEHIPDSPEGIILESLLEGMAEYYSAELAQKVRRGMKETRLKGHYQGGFVPYGYKVENKKLVLDEEKSKIVKELFTRYANGTMVSKIIDDFERRGILNKGKRFRISTVNTLLANESYTGTYRIHGEVYDNIYPAIISKEVFKQVQQRKKENLTGRATSSNVYLFRHKLICGYCGRPISAECGTSHTGKKLCYYKCIGRKKYHNGCQKTTLRKDYLEPFLLDCIIEELSKEKNMNTIVQNLLQAQENKDKLHATLNQLQKSKQQAEMQLNNIIDAIAQGIVNKTTNKKIQELEIEIEKIDEEIIIEEIKLRSRPKEKDIRQFYKEALQQEPQALVSILIKQIILYNNKIEIIFNNPQSPAKQDFSFTKNSQLFASKLNDIDEIEMIYNI